MRFTTQPQSVSAIQFTGDNAAEVARFQADHLKSMDLPRNKITDSFISETAKALASMPKLRGQWLVADLVSIRWVPDQVFSLLYRSEDVAAPAVSQTTVNGVEVVAVPILIEIPVDPLDGFDSSEAITIATERLRDLDLSITLGGVALNAVVPALTDYAAGHGHPPSQPLTADR
jgi:hypothetical protein